MIVLISTESFFDGETELIEEMFENGLDHFHLRKPEASLEELDLFLQTLHPKYFERIKLHQHFDLVPLYGLGGFHLKEHLRRFNLVLPESERTSLSTSFHKKEDLIKEGERYDYMFLSPVYDSISKTDYHGKNFDVNEVSGKVIGLGGVTTQKLDDLKTKGFQGAAVMGAIWESENPLNALKAFLDYTW